MIKKTKAWNSGQISGLDRNQATAEDELEVSAQQNAIRRNVYMCLHCSYASISTDYSENIVRFEVQDNFLNYACAIVFNIDKHEPQTPVLYIQRIFLTNLYYHYIHTYT